MMDDRVVRHKRPCVQGQKGFTPQFDYFGKCFRRDGRHRYDPGDLSHIPRGCPFLNQNQNLNHKQSHSHQVLQMETSLVRLPLSFNVLHNRVTSVLG
jgi:hypothetical protein